MRYLIIDTSTGQRLHSSSDIKKCLKLMKQLQLMTIAPLSCFIAKSDNHILGKVA